MSVSNWKNLIFIVFSFCNLSLGNAAQTVITPNLNEELVATSNYVSQCINKVSDGVRVKVNSTYALPCKKVGANWSYFDYPGKYSLLKVNGKLVIKMDILFIHVGTPDGKEYVKNRLKSLFGYFRAVLKKQNINLRISYNVTDRWAGELQSFAYDHLVYVTDKTPSENTNAWSDFWYLDEWRPDKAIYPRLMHELGHLMGLEDTHLSASFTQKCPDSVHVVGPFISSDQEDEKEFTSMFLTFKQAKRLLSPLCGQ